MAPDRQYPEDLHIHSWNPSLAAAGAPLSLLTVYSERSTPVGVVEAGAGRRRALAVFVERVA